MSRDFLSFFIFIGPSPGFHWGRISKFLMMESARLREKGINQVDPLTS